MIHVVLVKLLLEIQLFSQTLIVEMIFVLGNSLTRADLLITSFFKNLISLSNSPPNLTYQKKNHNETKTSKRNSLFSEN